MHVTTCASFFLSTGLPNALDVRRRYQQGPDQEPYRGDPAYVPTQESWDTDGVFTRLLELQEAKALMVATFVTADAHRLHRDLDKALAGETVALLAVTAGALAQ